MQVGKYELLKKIATGGMAEVFLARAAGPKGFQKILVVKRILPHLQEDPTFVDMFLSEAKLAAQFSHPNIVQIFDFGEAEGGVSYIAMEFVDGPNLRTLQGRALDFQTPLPVGVCAKIISLACEGLSYAHDFVDPTTGQALGVVHRDISPDNILVAGNGYVKVVDFGIAKATVQSHKTRTGTIKGKFGYMAPEQLQNQPLDRRTDVFALGMVLYELVTGTKPYDGSSEASTLKGILFEPFIPAVSRRADVPRELGLIIDRALAKEREQRYPDCRALQADLEKFMVSTGQPVSTLQISELVASLALPNIAVDLQGTPAPRVLATPHPGPAPMAGELGTEPTAARAAVAPASPAGVDDPSAYEPTRARAPAQAAPVDAPAPARPSSKVSQAPSVMVDPAMFPVPDAAPLSPKEAMKLRKEELKARIKGRKRSPWRLAVWVPVSVLSLVILRNWVPLGPPQLRNEERLERRLEEKERRIEEKVEQRVEERLREVEAARAHAEATTPPPAAPAPEAKAPPELPKPAEPPKQEVAEASPPAEEKHPEEEKRSSKGSRKSKGDTRVASATVEPPPAPEPPAPPPAASAEPAGDYDGLVASATKLLKNHQAQQALELFQKAAAMQAKRPEAPTGEGWSLVELGKPAEAVKSFRRALKIDKSRGSALAGLGKAYQALGDEDNAATVYLRYLDLYPNGPYAEAARDATR